jgi:hypothetical protein
MHKRADEPNCISPSKVASFLDQGSDFVRAINATEAFQVASEDSPLDLRPELMRAADRPMPSPGAKTPLGQSRLTIWLPPAISYPPFKERAIRPDQETYPGATLRVDPAVELVDWLLGRLPPHGVPSITMEGIENSDRVKSLLTELVTTSAGSVNRNFLIHTFFSHELFVQALKSDGGRAIMVAHDLREDSGSSKCEAIRRMIGKLKQIWKRAKKDVIDVGLQTPFAIAMIYTFYDYSVERLSAGEGGALDDSAGPKGRLWNAGAGSDQMGAVGGDTKEMVGWSDGRRSRGGR